MLLSRHPCQSRTPHCLHAKTRSESDKSSHSSPPADLLTIHACVLLDATGAANIGDAGVKQTVRADRDLIPDAAVRPFQDNSDYHTGRGGAGNEHIAKRDKAASGEAAPVAVADKLKEKLFSVFKK